MTRCARGVAKDIRSLLGRRLWAAGTSLVVLDVEIKVLRGKPAHTGPTVIWPGPKGRAGRHITDM